MLKASVANYCNFSNGVGNSIPENSIKDILSVFSINFMGEVKDFFLFFKIYSFTRYLLAFATLAKKKIDGHSKPGFSFEIGIIVSWVTFFQFRFFWVPITPAITRKDIERYTLFTIYHITPSFKIETIYRWLSQVSHTMGGLLLLIPKKENYLAFWWVISERSE